MKKSLLTLASIIVLTAAVQAQTETAGLPLRLAVSPSVAWAAYQAPGANDPFAGSAGFFGALLSLKSGLIVSAEMVFSPSLSAGPEFGLLYMTYNGTHLFDAPVRFVGTYSSWYFRFSVFGGYNLAGVFSGRLTSGGLWDAGARIAFGMFFVEYEYLFAANADPLYRYFKSFQRGGLGFRIPIKLGGDAAYSDTRG